jgi:tetratricopeptide (TPR) repeat protein
MLHASLLGLLEFTVDGQPMPNPFGRALELLVFLASSPEARSHTELEALFDGVSESELSSGLETFLPYIDFLPDGVRLDASSDVNAYRTLAGDLKALSKLRGAFCADLTSQNAAFQIWLERERFSLRRIFLGALLQNAAQLHESGRVPEGAQNLAFVERERATFKSEFAAELSLELARYHWRLNQPDAAAAILNAALPNLTGAAKLEATVNLGAALVRLGRLNEAVAVLEDFPVSPSQGWALLHRANARRFAGQLEAAIRDADAAYRAAAADEDGHLAVAALSVKGEALLEEAMSRGTEPKEAIIAFGKAFGISEILGEDGSAGTLAGLAHAHLVWGNQHKALEQGEKAFKRARAAHDGSSVIRALLALHAITRIGSFARNALQEAKNFQHKPLELHAALCVLEKDPNPELVASTLELARRIGSPWLLERAERFAAAASTPASAGSLDTMGA